MVEMGVTMGVTINVTMGVMMGVTKTGMGVIGDSTRAITGSGIGIGMELRHPTWEGVAFNFSMPIFTTISLFHFAWWRY